MKCPGAIVPIVDIYIYIFLVFLVRMDISMLLCEIGEYVGMQQAKLRR